MFADSVTNYAAHIREAGKQLPISMNGRVVLDALLFYMDGKTGRCDPCLDTIQKKSKPSRRTVVRQLDALREPKIINWVRRTVKTANGKGNGPQRQQTSNAYFIDMPKLPIEIVRTLRQKLGDKLRETAKHIEGSGKVPNRMAIKVERLAKSLSGAFGSGGAMKRSERHRLAGGSARDVAAHMYGGDLEPRKVLMKSFTWATGQMMTGFDIEAGAIRSFERDKIVKWLPVPEEQRGSSGARKRTSRIRRRAMFRRLSTARFLRSGVDDEGLWVGFSGKVSRIASVHQYGLWDQPALRAKAVPYPKRELLDVSAVDRESLLDLLAKHIADF